MKQSQVKHILKEVNCLLLKNSTLIAYLTNEIEKSRKNTADQCDLKKKETCRVGSVDNEPVKLMLVTNLLN